MPKGFMKTGAKFVKIFDLTKNNYKHAFFGFALTHKILLRTDFL